AGRDHGEHEDDIVNVGGADAAGQRDAGAIDEEMVFAAVFGSIGGVGAGVYPPKTARTLEESMTHLDQSSLPAFWSSCSSTAWMSFQVPLACHSASRRQQDMPEPQFISAGRSSQGRPVLRTKRIPVRALRSSSRGRPPFSLGSCLGSSGSMIA